ncbi:hypothetical protein QK285_15600 [Pseudarthrobacter sp. AL20]|uniref:hypothetical protein n=1 Tax=Pseudarthrobacter sp. AL20 TaxID=3042239 RepID=UPI00249B2E61|nr:hypothetical protein [Pseudarthrobacter sp. AL20]MDI3195826.1 hypothetical protein [Pseudarthrobacter sp. AL20]
MNTGLFREFLVKTVPAKGQVVNEDGAWAMFLPGLPLAAEGTTLEEATLDLIDALREYAEDWEDHLTHGTKPPGQLGPGATYSLVH